MDTIYLSFFGDGTHLDNLYFAVAYPTGYSYFRAFRYRDRWLHPQLLKEIREAKTRQQLVGEKAVLSIRFLTKKYEWLILPVRQVQITHIDYMPDNHSVYFTLGPMVDFRRLENLRKGCIELPKHERDGVSGGELFLRSSEQVPANMFVENGDEDYAWSAYTDKIAKDATLPIAEKARKSIFVRLSRIKSKKNVSVQQIYNSISMGKIYGPVLEEGSSYEMEIFHRVPSLIGLNKSINHLAVNYSAPTGNIELNRSEDDFGSNYQTHILIATAKKRSGAIEEVVIKPGVESVSVNKGDVVYADKLQIQLKVKFSFWYRLRTQWWAPLLLAIALFIMSLISGSGTDTEAVITIKGILSVVISVVITIAQSKM